MADTLNAAHVQPTIMALAHLALERPGWDMMCRDITKILDPSGIPLYESFQEMKEPSGMLEAAQVKIERLIKAGDKLAEDADHLEQGLWSDDIAGWEEAKQ